MPGMSLDLVPVPLHKLQLDCGLVQAVVEMGVCPALSIQGMDKILGNIFIIVQKEKQLILF